MVDAREYHERTNHVLQELRETDTSLDHANKPRPYKIYTGLPRVETPGSGDPPSVPALDAISTTGASGGDSNGANEGGSREALDIGRLCRYAAGVTKTIERRGQEMRFRAASCTGKLYHVDLYAVSGDSPGLDPGIYHYDPDSDTFDVLREGNFRGVLADASGGHTGVEDAPVTFVATSEWWRNAWKYRERTYRHAFWDSGTNLANLLAVAHAAGHRASVVTGFADQPVVDLLGLDADDEAPIELIPIGTGSTAPDASDVDPIDPDEEPLSPESVDYPIIPDAWRQSTLPDGGAVTEWREQFTDVEPEDVGRHGVGDGELIELDPVGPETASGRPIGNTIQRRGSLREFSDEPISDRMLATILDRALTAVPMDCFDGGRNENGDEMGLDRLLDAYCLVHAVDGIPSGAYQYHPNQGVLERIGDTDRQTAGEIALLQDVVGEAAVNVYLLADVDAIVERFGNRGYRVAQLEGGIGLGRLYLATYAHRTLGGRGFTFLDNRVTDHLSPRASNQSPMTLYAFGERPE